MSTGTQFWTPARIARDARTTVQAVERAAAAAGGEPALRVNLIGYFDDAGRAAIEAALGVAAPADQVAHVPPAGAGKHPAEVRAATQRRGRPAGGRP